MLEAEAEAEAEDKSSRPRPRTRTKIWPRGQIVLEDLTSLARSGFHGILRQLMQLVSADINYTL